MGTEVKGSKRWLDPIFLPRFQPVEILKPFFIVTLSLLLSLKNRKLYLKYFLYGYTFSNFITSSLSTRLGQTLLITMVWLALIFVSGINSFYFSLFFYSRNYNNLSSAIYSKIRIY